MVFLSAKESIAYALDFGEDVLKMDIVLGEQLLSEAEALLPTLLEESPADYPRMLARLEEIWRAHVMNVLMFDEDEVPTCH